MSKPRRDDSVGRAAIRRDLSLCVFHDCLLSASQDDLRSLSRKVELDAPQKPLDLQVDLKVYGRLVSIYQIKEVASRSGFSAATLRYYEEIGLLPEPHRTPAGYRLYDDRTLDRLAFIARSKHLGCNLEEITDLIAAWDGGQCGPVQERLRRTVGDKLAGAQQQMIELMTLTTQLRDAATALEQHRPDGACDDQCGCISDTAVRNAVGREPWPVALTGKADGRHVTPIVCTLDRGSVGDRIEEWKALLTHVERRQQIDGGLRVVFGASAPLGDLIRLVAAEHSCCRFLAFTIIIDTRGVALEVRAPADALPMVYSLFGVPQ